jgi:hypothetical protein
MQYSIPVHLEGIPGVRIWKYADFYEICIMCRSLPLMHDTQFSSVALRLWTCLVCSLHTSSALKHNTKKMHSPVSPLCSTYQYVPSMYQNNEFMFDTNWGTVLVLEHHSIHVKHTQCRFPHSYDIKHHPQKYFSKHGTYQYVQAST